MARIEDGGLHQRAVLWPVQVRADGAIKHDRYGEALVEDAPIEILCRWNTGRTETLDAQGNTIALDASAVVDRCIAVGSRMALGDVEDWGAIGTGIAPDLGDLMIVVSYNEVPDIRNRAAHRSVGLRKHRDTLGPQT